MLSVISGSPRRSPQRPEFSSIAGGRLARIEGSRSAASGAGDDVGAAREGPSARGWLGAPTTRDLVPVRLLLL